MNQVVVRGGVYESKRGSMCASFDDVNCARKEL